MKKATLVVAASLATLLVVACGKKEENAPAADAAATPAPAVEAAPAAEAATPAADATAAANGEKVFKGTCSMCHQTGAAGAPMLGNKADWEPRIAQGNDTLYKHAIEGFTGKKGMMPAKGGNSSLKDEDVKAAVDFMVAKVK